MIMKRVRTRDFEGPRVVPGVFTDLSRGSRNLVAHEVLTRLLGNSLILGQLRVNKADNRNRNRDDK